MSTTTELEQIAERNDQLRAAIPFVPKPNRLVATRGIVALGSEALAQILAKVKHYDAFSEENDPHLERDFGSFEYQGERLFWKIDDYAGTDGLQLVLTVLLAEEY